MAKQLNVNLSMTADTSKAKGQLQQLQRQLEELIHSAAKNSSLGLTEDISKAINSANELKVALQNATTSNGKLDLGQFNSTLKKGEKGLKDYANDLKALGPEGAQAFAQITRAINSADVPLRKTNSLLSEFATTLKNTARWQLSSSVLHGFMGSLQTAYGYAQDLNESLTNIRIVTGQTTDQMANFAEKANKAAQSLSTTTTKYTDAALIFYQQGLDDDAVEARTEATIKMAQATGDSATEVSSYMTAIWNNFDDGSESMEHYADVITALGASTASSSSEIASGLQQFAAIAKTTGLSYEYATSALATLVANTRQSADTIGNSLKTIFSRLQGLKMGETLEDGLDLNKYSKALKAIGVDVLDVNGNMMEMDDVLDETAGKWDNMTQAQKMAFAQTVAGTRQYTQLMALMDNWDDMQVNLDTAQNSDGTLQKQADIYAESWEAARDRVKAAAEAIYSDLLDDSAFINVLNIVEELLQGVDLLIDSFGGFGSMLPLIGSVLLKIFGPDLTSSIDNMMYNMQLSTEKGIQNTIQLRQEANQALREMMDTGNATDSATAAIFQSQADAQDRLIEKTVEIEAAGGRVSEQSLERVQAAMDLQQALGDEYIQLVKIKETQEAILKSQIRQAQYALKKSGKGDDFQKQIQSAKELEKEYQILARIKAVFDEAGTDRESDKFKQATEWAQKYTEALNETGALGEESIGRITKAVENITNPSKDAEEEINALGTTMEEVGDKAFTAFEGAEQMMVDAGTAPADAQKTMQGIIGVSDQIGASTDQVIQKFSDVTTQGGKVGEVIENMGRKSATMGDAVTEASQATMSFGMALSAISNFGENLFDKDVSAIQKIISGFMALSMAVKAYSAIRKAQKTLDEAIVALKAKNEAATLREIIAEKAHAAAVSARTIVEQFNNTVKMASYAISHKCSMAKAAEALGINMVTAATIAESGAVKANTAAWLSNPILAVVAVALLAVVAVIKAVSSAMKANSEAIAENAEKAREQAQASKEQADAEKELTDEYERQYDAYEKAKKAGEDTTQIKADLDQAARDLAEAYEEEHGKLQDVNTELLIAQGNYAELTNQIREHQKALVDQALTDNAVARANTAKEFEDTMRDDTGRFEGGKYKADFGNGTDFSSQFGKGDDEYWIGQAFDKNKDALSLMSKNKYGDGDINLEAGQGTQDLIQAYEQVQLLVNETARMASEAGPEALNSLNDSELYQNMIEWLEKSQEQYADLIALEKEYQDLKVQDIILDAENGIDLNAISSQEEYEEAQAIAVEQLTQALIDEGVAQDEAAEKAFNAVNAYMSANDNLKEYANTAKASSEAINEAVKPNEDGNESYWADKKEELQEFYKGLSDEQKGVFVNLNFDIAKSTEDLQAQLDVLQQVADVNEIHTNLSVINSAADTLASDGAEALENSGIKWGDEESGIIEFSEFLQKTKAEQIAYLQQLSQQYSEGLADEVEEASTAIDGEIESLQAQIDKMGEPQDSWTEEELANYNALNDEIVRLNAEKDALNAEPEGFSSIDTVMKMMDDIDNDIEKISLLNQVWNQDADSAREYNQALLEILDNTSQLTDNEKLGLLLSTEWDEATKASAEYKNAMMEALSGDTDLSLDQKMALIGNTISGGVEDAIQYGEAIAKIITSDENSTTEEKLKALDSAAANSTITFEDLDNAISDLIDNKQMGMEDLFNFFNTTDALSNYNDKVKELASNYDSCVDAVERYNEALRSGNEDLIAAASAQMELSTWAAQAAETYNLSADRVEAMADLYMDQVEALEAVQNGTANAAELATDLAVRDLRLNDAVEDLYDNWDDYGEILDMVNDTTYNSVDAIKKEIAQSGKLSSTFSKLKTSVAGLLNVSEDMFGDDFVIKNMNKIKKAAEGDEDAIKELQEAAAEEIALELDDRGVLDKLGKTASEVADWANNLPEGELGLDDTAYLQDLVNAMQAAGMAQEDIEKALSGLCLNVDLGPYEDALDQAAADAALAGAMASDSFASNAGVDTETKSETVEDEDTKEVIGWDAVATEVPLSGSVPNIQSSTDGGVQVNGNIPLTGSFPSVDITPTNDTQTETKSTTATALEVKGATKSSGGNLSHSNRPGGRNRSGGRGGRGGGGRRGGGSRPKERQNKDTKKHREIEGDLKVYDEEIERYHEIEKSIDNIQEKLDKYENIAGRAFGKAKVKALKDSAKAYKDLAKAYNTELQENQDWLNKDIAKARDYGWKLDADGNVSNYEENMKRLVNAQNAAEEKYLREYNKAVAWFNSLSGDAQAEEGNKKKFENLTKKAEEDLEDANKLYEDSVEALKQVEESQEKREELIKQQREALQKALDAEVEAVDVTVQVRLDIADADLKLLKEILEQIGDSADGAADAIGVIGQEVGDLEAKAKAARQGIAETLAVYTDRDLLGDNALDQSLVDKIMAGGELTVDDKESLLAAGITEDTISKLESYGDELIDVNGALRDLRDEALQKTSDAFDEFVENLDRSSEKIQHLQKVTETYKNIIDIVGKKVIDASGELTKQLGKANFEMQRNNTHALKSELEFIDQSIQNQKDAIARLMSDNANGQHDEAIKQMNQQLKEMEDQRDSTYESWLDSWQAEMQAAADIYAETLESVVDNFSDSLAGAFGSLDELEEEFSRKKEIQDLYLDDYRQIYELSKLTRDINKSIDDTDNIKSKQALKSLMKDIEQMQENGVKLSEYDLENLQRQYELELAKQQLKESQEAKSEVRMTRDSEGNYGYVYTADSNAVAEAEQNYEDKLYAMQKANADYIEDLQNNIISAEQACADALAELDASQFASYEEYQEAVAKVQADYSELIEGYYQQIGNALDNNRNLYQTEWTEYNVMTGYKISADEDYIDSFNETRLSILTGYSDIETAQEAWNQAVNAATNEAALAYEEWYERTQIALADGETSMQDFGSTVDEVTEDVLDRAEEAENSADAMADSYADAYTDILNALGDFCTNYDSKIQDIISSNTELVKSINKVTKAAANLDDYNNKKGSGSGNGGSGSGSGSDGGNNNSGGGNGNGGSNSGDEKKKGKASWDKGYAAYKRINAGAWGNGISNRISAGAKEGFSKAEVELGQKIINYTYPRSLHGLGYSMDKAKSLLGYDTGGYTGNWNSSDGKLALLHKKELVLNKDDTENMLKAVEVIREINKTIDLNALSASSGFASLLSSSSMINDNSQEIQQTVSIEASFPGVTERGEIEEAFNNLINRAAQFVNRKN